MPAVRDHRDLDVWKLSDEVRSRVTALVTKPSFNGVPWLRRQLREAAESLCPNIAEGFSRFYPTENASFVRIAKASMTEIIEHLERALALKLIEQPETAEVMSFARRARGAATRYVVYLESSEAAKAAGIPPSKRHRRRRQ